MKIPILVENSVFNCFNEDQFLYIVTQSDVFQVDLGEGKFKSNFLNDSGKRNYGGAVMVGKQLYIFRRTGNSCEVSIVDTTATTDIKRAELFVNLSYFDNNFAYYDDAIYIFTTEIYKFDLKSFTTSFTTPIRKNYDKTIKDMITVNNRIFGISQDTIIEYLVEEQQFEIVYQFEISPGYFEHKFLQNFDPSNMPPKLAHRLS